MEDHCGTKIIQPVPPLSPYSQSQISRDVVRLIIEKSRVAAGKNMPEIAKYLKAVIGDPQEDEEERKRFFRFKNFLYKTVKI